MIMIQLSPELRKEFIQLTCQYSEDSEELELCLQSFYDRVVSSYLDSITVRDGTRRIQIENEDGKQVPVSIRLNGRSKKVLAPTCSTEIELKLRRIRCDDGPYRFSSNIYLEFFIPYCRFTTIAVAEIVLNQSPTSRNREWMDQNRNTSSFHYKRCNRLCNKWHEWIGKTERHNWNIIVSSHTYVPK